MWTTSRYAAAETKNIARQLAEIFNQNYYARGKHTIEQLANDARRKGEERIFIIEEKDKQANELSVIAIDELGQWQRLGIMGIGDEI